MTYKGSLYNSGSYTFTQAMLAGVDSLGGCFVPTDIIPLPGPFFNNIAEMSACDVAYVVVNSLMGGDFKAEKLRKLVDEWIIDDMNLCAAGEGIYALEPFGGSTMSQYDLIGRLFAILLRDFYDRQVVSIDSVFFSPSCDDSCAAISHAFNSVIGKSPVMLQSVGVLTDVEKSQVACIVPREMLYVVTCDQDNLCGLCCRAMNNRTIFGGHEAIMISDVNVAAVVSRVFSYFEAYRHMAISGVGGRVVVCPDRFNKGDMLAAKLAVQLGLPVTLAETKTVDDTSAVISEVYSKCGYILSPRAAARWSILHNSLKDGEVGVFVQPSHPAKFRTMLEPLLNHVIALPHKLHFNDMQHVRYKHVAPSLNALKNCFINY